MEPDYWGGGGGGGRGRPKGAGSKGGLATGTRSAAKNFGVAMPTSGHGKSELKQLEA